MQEKQRNSFVLHLQKLVEMPTISAEAIKSLLLEYDLAPLTEELRQQSAHCKEFVKVLFYLPTQLRSRSAHEHETIYQSVCWCPHLSALILKYETLWESRTHGHHFSEEWSRCFRLLSHEKFVELILANQGNICFEKVSPL